MAQFFYDGQIRRYLLQVIRLLSNFVVKDGAGVLTRVPVMYGDMDRQVANIINQNSENALVSTPKIAVYINGLTMDRQRLSDSSFIGKMHIREREIIEGEYSNGPGQNFTVERLMPTPYRLTLKADIWTSSTEQKLQILEQILMLFNPSLEIQTTDNYIDWTSLSVVDLNDVAFSSRSVPVGTNVQLDIATLTLETPIWISPPVKVKKLGIITTMIANIFGDASSSANGYIDGLGTDTGGATSFNDLLYTQSDTIGDYDILVIEGKIRISSNSNPGTYLSWSSVVSQYPGQFQPGLSKIYLRQPDGNSVIGYVTISPLDESIMMVNWDQDTYPTNDLIEGPARSENSWGSFDAIIDPTKTPPDNPQPGTRYLIIENIGGGIREVFQTDSKIQVINTGISFDKVANHSLSVDGSPVSYSTLNVNGEFYIQTESLIPANSTVRYEIYTNVEGPKAWKNANGSDFIADANDIIEWDGSRWWVVFSANESTNQLVYQTNIFTLVQYKWDGISWTKSFEGEYKKGSWRLEL